MKTQKVQFKTIHGNIFGTPQWLYDSLNKEFNFTTDLACTEENKKAPVGITEKDDSLRKDWHKIDGWLWLNPPYSPLKPWIQKAQKEFLLGAKIVMLVPPHITSRYFQEVLPSQIRFIVGRVPFWKDGVLMKGNTSDSCLLIYGEAETPKPPIKTKIVYVERDSLKLV